MSVTVRIVRAPSYVRLVRQGGASGKSALAVAIEQGVVPEGTTEAAFATWLSSSNAAAAASAAAADASADQAAADAIATAADRVQTGLDRAAAAGSATAAAGSASAASGSAIAAAAEADDAQAARVAAQSSADRFGSVLDFDSLDYSVLLYFLAQGRRVVGQIELDGTWNITLKDLKLSDGSTARYFESLDPSLAPFIVVDPNGRIVGQVPDVAALNRIGVLEASSVQIAFYETLDTSLGAVVLDPNGRILSTLATNSTTPAEVIIARGNRLTLSDRMSVGLTPYGDVKAPSYGGWLLRETRMRLRKRMLAESAQLVIAIPGDSWVHGNFWTQAFAKQLQDTFGFAGIGWVGFGWWGTASGVWSAGTQPVGKNGCARPDLSADPTIIGAWTCTYNSGANSTPDLAAITSSTGGDYVNLAFPAGHTAAKLVYTGDGTGVVNYSWDAGATWSADVALAQTVPSSVTLAGVPAGAGTLRIQVVSGNVKLSGVSLDSSADGVRVHKLGGSGSSTLHWSGVTGAQWQAILAALGVHLFIPMLATNDQGSGRSPSTFATAAASISANLRAAAPSADILWVMPPENNRVGNAYPMTAYAQALREKSIENRWAFLDQQYFFGDQAADYAWANANRQWLGSDLIHPVQSTGGRVITDSVLRLLQQQ